MAVIAGSWRSVRYSSVQVCFTFAPPCRDGVCVIMEIKEAKYLTSCPSVDDCPQTIRTEVAFIGRSNVGKSSLINMLCNNSRLAKTSGIPGKTRLINYFEIKTSEGLLYFVDLPGYGFAKVSQSDRRRWQQMIEGYLRKRKNLANLFVLIDSRHLPQQIDLEFIGKLGKWQLPFTLVFTKSDKNKPALVEKHVNIFMEALRQDWEKPPVFFVSSIVNKSGRSEILNYISRIKNPYKI